MYKYKMIKTSTCIEYPTIYMKFKLMEGKKFRSRCNFGGHPLVWVCRLVGFQIISLNHHYHKVLQGTLGIFIYDPTLDKYIWWIPGIRSIKIVLWRNRYEYRAKENQSDMIITVSAILMQPGRARSSLFPPWQDNQIKSTM